MVVLLDIFVKIGVKQMRDTSIAMLVVLKMVMIQMTKNSDSNLSKNSPGIFISLAISIAGYIIFTIPTCEKMPIPKMKIIKYKITGMAMPYTIALVVSFGLFIKLT
ncbi:hypothetical protein D3C81_2032500 [compost metagenome]